MEAATLATIIAILPVLYIMQASLERSSRRREWEGARNRYCSTLRKRARRREAVAILRALEREMQVEETYLRESIQQVRSALPNQVGE